MLIANNDNIAAAGIEFSFSKQEKKIINSLSTGSLYKEIAAQHEISVNTVKKHLKKIYRKMNVNKRSKATEIYLMSVSEKSLSY